MNKISLFVLFISFMFLTSSLFLFLIPYEYSKFTIQLRKDLPPKMQLVADYYLFKNMPKLSKENVDWFCSNVGLYKDQIDMEYVDQEDLDYLCSLKNLSVIEMKKNFVNYYTNKKADFIFDLIKPYINNTFIFGFISFIIFIILYVLSYIPLYLKEPEFKSIHDFILNNSRIFALFLFLLIPIYFLIPFIISIFASTMMPKNLDDVIASLIEWLEYTISNYLKDILFLIMIFYFFSSLFLFIFSTIFNRLIKIQEEKLKEDEIEEKSKS